MPRPSLETQYSLLLIAVVLAFTSLGFAGWQYFTSTLQLRQDETELTSVLAEWNNLVADTRALYISSNPVRTTFQSWEGQRASFLRRFDHWETTLHFMEDQSSPLPDRFRLFLEGLRRGLLILQNVSEICSELLETLNQEHPGLADRLSALGIKSELQRRQAIGGYSFVLVSQLEQRIAFLDSIFGSIFHEDQEQMRQILSRRTEEILEGSRWGWFVLIAMIFAALVVFLWRIRAINATLQNMVNEKTQSLRQALAVLTDTQGDLLEAQRQASITSLVVGLSHEINTPLGIAITSSTALIDSAASYLQPGDQDEPPPMKARQVMQKQADLGALLVKSLEKVRHHIEYFKRLATDLDGERERSFVPFETLSRELASFSALAERQGITVEIDIPPGLAMKSYPGALTSIIRQLAENSLSHAFQGRRNGRIWLKIADSPQESILEYGDDGIGVAPANRTKIFEPFFTTARSKGSIGLGLNIVFNQVKHQLHGSLELRDVEKGLVFVIRIPKEKPHSQEKIS